jgi:hypothetical protein
MPDKLGLVLLRGTKPEFDTGTDASKLSSADFAAMLTNAILMEYSPYLRAADRKLEYAFKNPIHTTTPSANTFAQRMYDYLRDTLAVTAVINHQGDKSLKNFKKNGTFSYFEDMLKSTTLRGKLSNITTVEEVEKVMKDNEKAILKEFEAYYNGENGVAKVKQRLIDEGVVKGDTTIGLSKEALKKNGILVGSKTNINKLAEVVFYNYTVGAIEQTKLITGDPRHFKNALDFHKRTTGAASTKVNSMWGELFNNNADGFYKRVDNKTGESRDIIRTIVYDDVEITSELYEELFGKDLAIANEGDAQGRMSLDEYRETMLKNGKWSEAAQETVFLKKAYRITKNEKYLEKLEELGLETKFPENFNPVYLEPLPPIKPQGFGNIYDRHGETIGGYVTDFTKLSIEPILPSIASEFMFDRLLDMVEEGVGLAVFESGKKGDKLSEDGLHEFYDPESGTNGDIKPNIIQGMHYRDFGIQLDIDPAGKTKVTRSSQMERLWDVNFPGTEEERRALRNAHTEARDGLHEIAVENVFNKLGITEKDGDYNITNTERFKDTLLQEFEQRLMEDNVYKGLITLAENIEKGATLNTLANNDAIQSVLWAMIRKELLQIKTTGDMLVQTSAIGTEAGSRDMIRGEAYGINPNLKFYERIYNKDGEVIGVTPMEVEIPLPKKWAEWIINTFEGNTFQDKLNNFNTALSNSKNDDRFPEGFEKLIEFPLNRTPADDIHNIEYAKVKKFLPPHVGSKVTIPTEVVLKSGSDFDIDKLTAYFNNFELSKDKKPIYQEYISISEFAKDPAKYANTLWERQKKKIISKDEYLSKKETDIYDKASKELDKRLKGISISTGIRDARVDALTDVYTRQLETIGVNEDILNTLKEAGNKVGYSYNEVYKLGEKFKAASRAVSQYESNPSRRNYNNMRERIMRASGENIDALTADNISSWAEAFESVGDSIMDLTAQYHIDIRKQSTAYKEYMEKADALRKEIYNKREADLLEEVYNPARALFDTFSVAKKNGKKALENSLNDVIKKSILHPKNYENLLNPTEAPTLNPSSDFNKKNKKSFVNKNSKQKEISYTDLIAFGTLQGLPV